MYQAVEYFTDNLDNGYTYNVGDVYPHEGYTPTEERIQELASDLNVRRRPVIAEITNQEVETVAEVAAEDIPEEAPEEEKPKRKRKKAE